MRKLVVKNILCRTNCDGLNVGFRLLVLKYTVDDYAHITGRTLAVNLSEVGYTLVTDLEVRLIFCP